MMRNSSFRWRWHRRMLALAAFSIVCAGCGANGSHAGRDSTPQSALGSQAQDAHSSAGSIIYRGYSGTAIVSSDAETLIVGPYGLSCSATVSVVARESAAAVALFLQYRVPAKSPRCPAGAGSMQLKAEQSLHLRSPLDSRILVDGATMSPIASLSGRLILHPTSLPAGYRLREFRPWLNHQPVAASVQIYASGNDPDVLEFVQYAGPLVLSPGPGGWTDVRVRGFTGRASGGRVSWTENGLTNYLISNGEGATHSLSVTQLVAIADTATPTPD